MGNSMIDGNFHPISSPQKHPKNSLNSRKTQKGHQTQKAKIIKPSSHFIKFSTIFHERKENARNYDKKSTLQADKSR
jgi:hypothetical protein